MRGDNWSKQRHIIREKYLELVFKITNKKVKNRISDISDIPFSLERKVSNKKNIDRKPIFKLKMRTLIFE
jgi:hypothetical protein